MKVLCLLVFAATSVVWAQSAPATPAPPALPDLPDDAVVAVFGDGTKFTMGDFRKIYVALPPNNQQLALQNRALFLKQWELLRNLTKLAEDAKLDQESPYRETLSYGRMNVLATAQINHALNQIVVEPAEVVKYYDDNRQTKYTQVRVKAIYLSFNDDPDAPAGPSGKKPLNEAQAKAKAEKLVTSIKGGADFVKLVKENSDDETSREKNGDFATLRASDNIPDAFRAAVFALKQGEVTSPLKQPNGFYILRAEEVTTRALSDVRDEIYNDVKNIKGDEWIRAQDKAVKVEIVNKAFVDGTPAPAAPPAKK
ncbi:MAG: peptidylprolyl isomerase [Candidatus Solibacter sp.]